METMKTSLTVLEGGTAERLAYLERDRWLEFERALRLRHPRKFRFDVHHYGAQRRAWEWLVWRCRTWEEVERVLNRYKVFWERERGQIVMERMSIYRYA
jgi:hypothetical protein